MTQQNGRKKIVFVIGAGFSVEAGAPKQNDILQNTLRRGTANARKLKDFVENLYGHSEGVPLEDLFTALDRSIQRDESLRGFQVARIAVEQNDRFSTLIEVRDSLLSEMSQMFRDQLSFVNPDSLAKKSYIDGFCRRLLDWRLAEKELDRFSILSLNWDIFLDNAFGSMMATDPNCTWGGRRRVFVDHCMMDKQLDKTLVGQVPASLTIKASKCVNLKLLKLHGSFNWLRCPNCDSLFVGYGEKHAALLEHERYYCWVCRDNWNSDIRLRPYLLSPTFLKDLDNVHYKSIWWNAGIELSEASHIVFIGYSFPLSDFELRYLFSRFVRHDAKIRVIDSDDPQFPKPVEMKQLRQRYQSLFGARVEAGHVTTVGAKRFCEDIALVGFDDAIKFLDEWRYNALPRR